MAKTKDLGSAKSGTDHWWMQRLSAIALAILSFFVVLIALNLVGKDYASAHTYIAKPWVAGTLILFLAAAFYHAALGMQEVIVDYIHGKKTLLFALIANKLMMIALGLASILSILIVMMKAFGS